MFTVKFYTQLGDASHWEHISCPRYSANKKDDGTTLIVCYKDMTGSNGVEFMVGPSDWDACFVENSASKTIDKHRARFED